MKPSVTAMLHKEGRSYPHTYPQDKWKSFSEKIYFSSRIDSLGQIIQQYKALKRKGRLCERKKSVIWCLCNQGTYKNSAHSIRCLPHAVETW